MTYFQLFFISYACLGDIGFLGFSVNPVPKALRPALSLVRVSNYPATCQPIYNVERPLTIQAIQKRVKEIGPYGLPKFQWCEKFKCRDRKIEWGDKLFVDGLEVK